MVLEGLAHRLDLCGVVVDPGIEAPAEDGAPEVGDEVHREPAPPGGQLVEHRLGLLGTGARDAVQTLHELRRRHQLVGDQLRGLVGRSEQTQFHSFHPASGRPAQDETGEVLLGFPDRVLPATAGAVRTTLAGSPATMRARDGPFFRIARWSICGGR